MEKQYNVEFVDLERTVEIIKPDPNSHKGIVEFIVEAEDDHNLTMYVGAVKASYDHPLQELCTIVKPKKVIGGGRIMIRKDTTLSIFGDSADTVFWIDGISPKLTEKFERSLYVTLKSKLDCLKDVRSSTFDQSRATMDVQEKKYL